MKVGLCTGVLDDLHEGHKFFLNQCEQRCDYLVVAVNTDAWVRAVKGEGRPIIPLFRRMLRISNYLADESTGVIPFAGDHENLIHAIRPDVIFRGFDQAPGEELFGIPIVRIPKGPDVSTTQRLAK